MSREEFIGKLNALYVGEKNCLEELLTIYDEQEKEIGDYQQNSNSFTITNKIYIYLIANY